MKKKTLGNSDLGIAPIGLGAWAIGGDWQFGWGDQDDKDSISAFHRALELGINWIDRRRAQPEAGRRLYRRSGFPPNELGSDGDRTRGGLIPGADTSMDQRRRPGAERHGALLSII